MVHNFIAKDLDDIKDIAQDIAELLDGHPESNVVLFYGAMGAGKTTLIRSICDAMGVEDTVTSPTFAIINEYERASGNAIYHFDFYRVEDIREAYDMGYDTYFDSGDICLVEWPERIDDIIKRDEFGYARLTIEVNSKDHRVISLEF